MKEILATSLIASLFAARTLAQGNLTCGYTQYDPSEYTYVTIPSVIFALITSRTTTEV